MVNIITIYIYNMGLYNCNSKLKFKNNKLTKDIVNQQINLYVFNYQIWKYIKWTMATIHI